MNNARRVCNTTMTIRLTPHTPLDRRYRKLSMCMSTPQRREVTCADNEQASDPHRMMRVWRAEVIAGGEWVYIDVREAALECKDEGIGRAEFVSLYVQLDTGRPPLSNIADHSTAKHITRNVLPLIIRPRPYATHYQDQHSHPTRAVQTLHYASSPLISSAPPNNPQPWVPSPPPPTTSPPPTSMSSVSPSQRPDVHIHHRPSLHIPRPANDPQAPSMETFPAFKSKPHTH